MRIICSVVRADARVIAANNEMRAAIVLADDRMKHRLAWTGITHSRGINRKQSPILREVVLEHRLVTLHSHFRRYVVGFCFADQRMKQQSINGLKRALDDVLLSSMDRVASLKRDHSLPTLLLESVACLLWVQSITWECSVARAIPQAAPPAPHPLV